MKNASEILKKICGETQKNQIGSLGIGDNRLDVVDFPNICDNWPMSKILQQIFDVNQKKGNLIELREHTKAVVASVNLMTRL